MVRSALACSVVLLLLPAPLPAQQPAQPVLIDLVSQRPVLLDSACLTPKYPSILREAGIEGRVVIEFVVDTSGAVEPWTLRVLSSTHQLFEIRATAAVEACRYRPGSQGGQLVRVRMIQPINFLLR